MSINVTAIRAVIQNARDKAKTDYDAAKVALASQQAAEVSALDAKHAAEVADLEAQHASGLSWADQVLSIPDPTFAAHAAPPADAATEA